MEIIKCPNIVVLPLYSIQITNGLTRKVTGTTIVNKVSSAPTNQNNEYGSEI